MPVFPSPRRPLIAALLSVSLVAGLVAGLAAAAGAADQISPQRLQTLKTLLVQDCGSCHGLNRRGGLGTPLTPEALAEQDDDALIDTILMGRTGTAMPPWDGLIDRAEAGWMVQQLRHAPVEN